MVTKKLFLIAFLLSLVIIFLPLAPARAAYSVKKGVGIPTQVIPSGYCDNKADPAACEQRLKNGLNSLGISWFYNWTMDAGVFGHAFAQGLEYVPMVFGPGSGDSNGTYTPDELANISYFAHVHPGRYWLFWNEPDNWWFLKTIGNLNGDDKTDEKDSAIAMGRSYKKLRDAIKDRIYGDETAKLIIGGLSTPNDNRWQTWGDLFLQTYRAVNPGEEPDFQGWHEHMYSCGAHDSVTWEGVITNFRRWINTYGGGSSKEFWLTEFGCLTAERPQIISAELDWMENYPGINRYAWFSAGQYIDNNGNELQANLFNGYLPDNPSFGLSSIGQTYAQYPLAPASTPTPTATPRPLLGDIDGNGLVGESDQIWLNSCYDPLNPPANNHCRRADLNSDQIVNALDYSILLSHWGERR